MYVRAVPQLSDPTLLGQNIRDAIESPHLMGVWRYPDMESNSCIFGHQYEMFIENTNGETSARDRLGQSRRRDNIVSGLTHVCEAMID